jgi:hypothetical protein
MNTADRIINALGNVEIDDTPRLLIAVLQLATDEQVAAALVLTHPTLLESA